MKTNEKLYYKAVSVLENGSLHSCVQCESVLNINYRKGRWSKPNTRLLAIGHGLTVFNSLAKAKKFKLEYEKQNIPVFSNAESWAIYSCKIEEAKTKPMSIFYCSDCYSIDEFIEAFTEDNQTRVDWPEGTIFCSKVKLIEKVG